MFEPPGGASQTSLDFLAALRNGNSQAWSEFHRLYGPMMMARCLRIGFQHADAEEVVARFFSGVHTALMHRRPNETGGFQHEPPRYRFRFWLRGVFQTICQDMQRELARNRARSNQEGLYDQLIGSFADEASITTSDADVRRAIHPYLKNLEAELAARGKFNVWQLLLLAEGLGWSSQEIAEELNMSPPNVRQTHSRYLKRLRAEIDGRPSDGPDHC